MLTDKRINIRIDDSVNLDNPKVVIDAFDDKLKIIFDVSMNSEDIWNTVILPKQKEIIVAHAIGNEMARIFDATHQAYLKATTKLF